MANDPQTYAELITSVGLWLNRTDLADRVPEFIALAERRFNRILNMPEMDTLTTLTAAASVALPSDCWEVRSVYLDTDPRQKLEPVSIDMLFGLYPDQTTGRPAVYAISGSSLVLAPSPDAADSLVLYYKSTIPALSSSNTTNWLLTKHPDIYLWASLLASEAYNQNDARLSIWDAKLSEALTELAAAGKRARFPGPIRMRPTVKWGI